MGTSVRYERGSLAKRGTAGSASSGCGCKECGGLECLCRPRFFAGQLLTEEEFNRLDKYIVEKNKLHNRYLHGWGVVCGLDVVCDDCGNGVVVKEGYALSPCGEDIVVCDDTRVDICSLINACQKKEQPDCGSPTANTGCNDTEQQWVLAVCYSETTSRGITPLRNGGTASGDCGCGCGGHTTSKSSGGCGCGGGGSHKSSSSKQGGCGCGGSGGHSHAGASGSTRSCSQPLQCEPTVVCEGYSFRVYPAPRGAKNDEKTSGAMVERFQACYREIIDIIPELPQGQSQQELHDWCCDTKQALLDYVATHPGYDCQLRRTLSQIVCPSATMEPAPFMAAIALARQQLGAILMELLFACLCRALMPPCPEPTGDNCVPLAVVTVDRSNGCKVESICNWTTLRKYATTFPNLQYWLSILPFGRTIRESLERFCCSGGGLRDIRRPQPVDPTTGVPGGPAATTPAASAQPGQASGTVNTVTMASRSAMSESTMGNSAASDTIPNPNTVPPRRATLKDISPADSFRPSTKMLNQNRVVSALAKDALMNRRQSVNAETLLLGILGEKDDKGQDYLSTTQRDNLAQFFVLDQMAKPMLRSIMPVQGEPMDLGALMSMFSAMTAKTPAMESSATPRTTSPATAAATPAATSATQSSNVTDNKTVDTAATNDVQSDLRAEVNELREMVKRQQVLIDQLAKAANVSSVGTTAGAVANPTTSTPTSPTAANTVGKPVNPAAKTSTSPNADTTAKPSSGTTRKSGTKGNVKRRPGPSNS